MADEATVLEAPRALLRPRIARALRDPGNWAQLLRFALVGRERLRRQPRRLRRRGRRAPGLGHRVGAVAGLPVARDQQLRLEPRVDLPRPRRPRRASRPRASSSVSLAAFLVSLGVLELLVSVAGLPERPGAGDRDRVRDAAELPRQPALELPALTRAVLVALAAAALLLPAATARAQSAGSAPTSAESTLTLIPQVGGPPEGRRRAPAAVTAAALRVPKVARVRAEHPDSVVRTYLKDRDRWQVERRSTARRRARAGLRRRPHGPRHRGLDRDPGRLDDGARLRRARSAAARTRSTSGCRCWRCSCCRSCDRRGGSCTSTSRPWRRSRCRSRSSTTRDIGASVPLAYPPLVYLLVRMVLLARARAAGPRRPPVRLLLSTGHARDGDRVPARASGSA